MASVTRTLEASIELPVRNRLTKLVRGILVRGTQHILPKYIYVQTTVVPYEQVPSPFVLSLLRLYGTLYKICSLDQSLNPAKHGENTLTIRLKSDVGNIRLSLVIALELVTTTLLRSCQAWDNLYIQEKSIILKFN